MEGNSDRALGRGRGTVYQRRIWARRGGVRRGEGVGGERGGGNFRLKIENGSGM